MQFDETFTTKADLEAAFAYLIDFRNLPAWDPSIIHVDKLDPGDVRKDTRFAVSMSFLGLPSTLDYRVEEIAPGKRAVLVGTAMAATATDTIAITPLRSGLRVHWRAQIEFWGPLAWLDPVFAWMFGDNVTAAVKNLKRELDRLPRA
jgi:carbon monoxide dehydrogenase subunit G